jgi:HK97 family phage portal protein
VSTFTDVSSLLRRTNGSPVPYVARAATNGFTSLLGGGRTSELQAMGSLGTIFSIVDGISSFGANLDWTLRRKAAPDADPTAPPVEVTRHAVLDTWNRPNNFMSRSELVEISLQHLNLTGEVWWLIVRDQRSKMPLEVWPVRPDRIEPNPHPELFIKDYIYSAPGGEKITLELDDVIFIRRPNPLDPYRGLGPVQSVLVDIDASRYTAEWNRSFFVNSAEPGGVIEAPEGLTDTEYRNLQARWNEQHRGVSNAHRVAIIERGKWVPRTFTMRDMQFRELREVNAETIRRAWRWPAALNGDSGDINRATAQAHEYMAGKWIIDPQMKRILSGVERLTEMFFPQGKPADVEWHVESAVPDDEEAENAERDSRASAWAAMVSAGADPEWAAEVVGLPLPAKGKALTVPRPAAPMPANSVCPSCGLHHEP